MIVQLKDFSFYRRQVKPLRKWKIPSWKLKKKIEKNRKLSCAKLYKVLKIGIRQQNKNMFTYLPGCRLNLRVVGRLAAKSSRKSSTVFDLIPKVHIVFSASTHVKKKSSSIRICGKIPFSYSLDCANICYHSNERYYAIKISQIWTYFPKV